MKRLVFFALLQTKTGWLGTIVEILSDYVESVKHAFFFGSYCPYEPEEDSEK